jgi:PKD repeat protein
MRKRLVPVLLVVMLCSIFFVFQATAVVNGKIAFSSDPNFNPDIYTMNPDGTEQNPSHTYTVPGTYQVTLLAYNAQGHNSTSKTAYITIPAPTPPATSPIIINHTSTNLSQIPLVAITNAKSQLHIAYGHTSHGSQIITGMEGLITFPNAPYGGSTYTWNNGGTGGALDIRDKAGYYGDLGNYDKLPDNAADLGNPNFTAWANSTRTYLQANPDVNVIIWSWCEELTYATETDVNTYLSLMNQLEKDYPNVKFVYMTGTLEGTGEAGILNQRNEQIRNYVRANNKTLYDFADIESFDPDGIVNYMKLNADYTCKYDGGNWAIAWQNSHTQGVDWYNCEAAHTQPLNANLKAYAAWHLWARLGGWDGHSGTVAPVTGFKIGVFRNNHDWLLDANGNGVWEGAGADKLFALGKAGDIPVVGDWNGNGIAEIGVFRDNHTWNVDYNGNGIWDGPSGGDKIYITGKPGDIPVPGDWNGNNKTEMAVFRDNHTWYIDYNGNGIWDSLLGGDKIYIMGKPGDIPVPGDWNGDGITEMAVFRGSHTWYIDYNGNGVWDSPAGGDRIYTTGQPGDLPVYGDWNGDRLCEMGVFRPSNHNFYLDFNANGLWDGASVDKRYDFGTFGDIPVSGKW